MNKSELIEYIAGECKMTKAQTERMLDATLEPDEQIEGIVSRLPVHEEAGVERVHFASALEVGGGVDRAAFVQLGAQSLEMIKAKDEIP